jgi:hypothetical protein
VETPPEEAIRLVLQRYIGALEARDLPALRRLWPSLGSAQEQAIRDEFQNARDINVTIEGTRIETAGETATVSCLRHYRIQTRDGHRLETNTRTTIGMRKTGPSSWVIDTIRHEQP